MKIGVKSELIALNLVAFILVAVIILSLSNILRYILGIPFLLFFPGYALIAALFPKRGKMSGIERVALSFGLSIAVVPLMGLVLNYTPWGIRLEPILYSVASFILIASVIAWSRRRRLGTEERFNIEFQVRIPGWGVTRWDKALSITLIVTIVGALGMLGYAIAAPKVREKFTEFYLVGLSGKAMDYPQEVMVGKDRRVMVVIINHEQVEVSYRIEVNIDGVKNNEVGPVVLAHEQKWESEISFVPEVTGENQKVEFLLYKEGQTGAYRKLHLWVDVTE